MAGLTSPNGRPELKHGHTIYETPAREGDAHTSRRPRRFAGSVRIMAAMDVTITTARSFDPLNLSAETLASLDAMGYKAPTDVQFETDSPRTGRQGPRRAVPDGDRQDRRLRHPDDREGGPRDGRRPGGGPGAHPRARHPGRRGADPDRQGQGRAHRDDLRRRLHGPPARRHSRRRARHRGHARPRARPPAAQDPALRAGQDARPRRGGPHARHGLRGRDGPDHGVHAGGAADASSSRPPSRSASRGSSTTT